jgi:hypothetical protein
VFFHHQCSVTPPNADLGVLLDGCSKCSSRNDRVIQIRDDPDHFTGWRKFLDADRVIRQGHPTTLGHPHGKEKARPKRASSETLAKGAHLPAVAKPHLLGLSYSIRRQCRSDGVFFWHWEIRDERRRRQHPGGYWGFVGPTSVMTECLTCAAGGNIHQRSVGGVVHQFTALSVPASGLGSI